MKSRWLASILCKLLGLYLIYQAIIGLPSFVAMLSPLGLSKDIGRSGITIWLVILVFVCVIGIALLISSNKIAHRMFPGDKNDAVTSISPPNLMAIGLAVVGIIIMVNSFHYLAYAAAYFWKHPHITPDFSNSGFADLGVSKKQWESTFKLYHGELINGIIGLLTGCSLVYWSNNLSKYLWGSVYSNRIVAEDK